jgi:hypothetical protein
MRFDYFVKQNAILHKLGKQIIENVNYKNNFYNIPPREFERKAGQQKRLINEYIERSEDINSLWRKNNQLIYDYLFSIHR